MALPIPLSALQRYVPTLFLLLLNTYGCPVNKTSLSLPLANTFVQVMFGVGTPATSQGNEMLAAPSTTTWSGLGLLKLGGTKQEGKLITTHILKVNIKAIKGISHFKTTRTATSQLHKKSQLSLT